MDLANTETAFNSSMASVDEEICSMESSRKVSQLVRRRDTESTSKVNASWGNTVALCPSTTKLSMHASMELIGGHSFNSSKSLDDEEDNSAVIEAQLRRRLVRDAEIDQLLSMLQSTTFIGNYDPKHHGQWRPPSPLQNVDSTPIISRSKFPSAC